MEEENKPQTPMCQYKGCLPHAATPAYLLVWSLPSGPVVKWSCAEHRFSFGGNRRYAVAKFECFGNMEEARLREMREEKERAFCESDDETLDATCADAECFRPARKGQLCAKCHSRSEEE